MMNNKLDDDFDDYHSVMYGNRFCGTCIYFRDYGDGIHGECRHPDNFGDVQSNYESCRNYYSED